MKSELLHALQFEYEELGSLKGREIHKSIYLQVNTHLLCQWKMVVKLFTNKGN